MPPAVLKIIDGTTWKTFTCLFFSEYICLCLDKSAALKVSQMSYLQSLFACALGWTDEYHWITLILTKQLLLSYNVCIMSVRSDLTKLGNLTLLATIRLEVFWSHCPSSRALSLPHMTLPVSTAWVTLQTLCLMSPSSFSIVAGYGYIFKPPFRCQRSLNAPANNCETEQQ